MTLSRERKPPPKDDWALKKSNKRPYLRGYTTQHNTTHYTYSCVKVPHTTSRGATGYELLQ
jgi:hypothetical protein